MDILPDPRIRQVLSEHSGWPTIPQLFIDGELVGGCDIVTELHEAASCRRWSTPPDSRTAAVVGAGVIGLSAARALREDGFSVTVYEQHRVGTPLGSSPGRSRIYRTSYRVDDYCRLGRRAIEEWMRLDPALLLRNGLMEYGTGVEQHAAALDGAASRSSGWNRLTPSGSSRRRASASRCCGRATPAPCWPTTPCAG